MDSTTTSTEGCFPELHCNGFSAPRACQLQAPPTARSRATTLDNHNLTTRRLAYLDTFVYPSDPATDIPPLLFSRTRT